MCETKKRLLPELQQLVNGVERPMRWAKAERLAKRFSRDVLQAWQNWQKELYAALPEPQDFNEIRQQVKEGQKNLPAQIMKDLKAGAEKKVYTPEQIRILGARASQYVAWDKLENMENIFDKLLDTMMTGGGDV